MVEASRYISFSRDFANLVSAPTSGSTTVWALSQAKASAARPE